MKTRGLGYAAIFGFVTLVVGQSLVAERALADGAASDSGEYRDGGGEGPFGQLSSSSQNTLQAKGDSENIVHVPVELATLAAKISDSDRKKTFLEMVRHRESTLSKLKTNLSEAEVCVNQVENLIKRESQKRGPQNTAQGTYDWRTIGSEFVETWNSLNTNVLEYKAKLEKFSNRTAYLIANMVDQGLGPNEPTVWSQIQGFEYLFSSLPTKASEVETQAPFTGPGPKDDMKSNQDSSKYWGNKRRMLFNLNADVLTLGPTCEQLKSDMKSKGINVDK